MSNLKYEDYFQFANFINPGTTWVCESLEQLKSYFPNFSKDGLYEENYLEFGKSGTDVILIFLNSEDGKYYIAIWGNYSIQKMKNDFEINYSRLMNIKKELLKME